MRELQNLIQRVYYISENDCIDSSLLSEHITHFNNVNHNYEIPSEKPFKLITLEDMEKNLISDTLNHCNGNVIMASKLINISKSTLYRKIKKYNISTVSN
ncbi:MAG: hypothetical protein KAX49_15835 [Halanaerobiales bacterium]|nr:hypothetical protein [Halanaerobiales bacterium]